MFVLPVLGKIFFYAFLPERGVSLEPVVMDAVGMDRALMRIAHQIIEKNESTENLCVIGIKRRGEQLGDIVSKNLENHGFNVVSSYNSDRIKDKSELVDHNAKYASDEIKKIYSSLPVKNDENDKAEVDVTVYIGNDFTF